MNKKRIAQYCCAALVAAGVGLNIQNALENYGIGENSLSLVAIGGSDSNSNSNSNWDSNTDTWPDMSDSDSNSNGNNNNNDGYEFDNYSCDWTIDNQKPGETVNVKIGTDIFSRIADENGEVHARSYGWYCNSKPDGHPCTPRQCPEPVKVN